MVEGEIRRLGHTGRWVTLLLVAVALIAGLMTLPGIAPSRSSARHSTAAQSLTALHALNTGQIGPGGTIVPPSPYAQLVPADAPKIYAGAAYLMDPKTGEVFYANNALKEAPMASTTKIMTALVALTFGKPDQKITMGADAVAEQNGINSVAGVVKGDVLSLHDMLYALMLPSGDDVAVAIADGVAGSESKFVDLMNMEAALLGLTHTHYTNVHGLDATGHYTTVGDLARIARVAMNFPLFAQIVKTPTYSVTTPLHGTYTWHTTNELLTPLYAYQGATGVKTGYTLNAGYCLVFAATRNGSTLIGALLGERDDTGSQRFVDATALLNWGFAREQNISRWFNAIAGKH
ncbi:MAG: D-alanyl-D-alanine carboxypeptidase family protein [Nitrososphaerota archaeon]